MSDSYFATSEFLKLASTWITTFTLPVNTLAIFLVYYKTPSSMKSLKWVLLYSLSWGFTCDLVIGTLSTPLLIIPFCGGSFFGLLGKIGVSASLLGYINICVVANVACSIVFIYENSHHHISSMGHDVGLSQTRFIIYGIHILFSFLFIVPIFFPFPDQEFEKSAAIEKMPALIPILNKHPITFVTSDPIKTGVLVFFITALYIVESFFYIFKTFYCMFLAANSHFLSVRTRKMQRKYVKQIFLQTSIQGLVLTTPVGYIVYSIVNMYHNQALNNIAILMLSCHGSSASLATIFIYQPYRSAVLYPIKIFIQKVLFKVIPGKIAVVAPLESTNKFSATRT